jgi:hypothetical protein
MRATGAAISAAFSGGLDGRVFKTADPSGAGLWEESAANVDDWD